MLQFGMFLCTHVLPCAASAVPVCSPCCKSFIIADQGASPKTEVTCDTDELTISGVTCAVKACAQGPVGMEGEEA